MKQSLNKFFNKYKYGRLSLALIIATMILSAVLLYPNYREQEQPIALSEVASAISAGKVSKIEDTPNSGLLTVYYTDGTKHIARRDLASSSLEQMKFLGVSEDDLAQLQYRIVEPPILNGEKATNITVTLFMLGLAGFVITRINGGSLNITNKKYAQGAVPDITFDHVAGVDECRDELIDIVTFLKDNSLYREMGARMPRGLLLVGEPGTGKTLLAKAIAGEAGVPFFST